MKVELKLQKKKIQFLNKTPWTQSIPFRSISGVPRRLLDNSNRQITSICASPTTLSSGGSYTLTSNAANTTFPVTTTSSPVTQIATTLVVIDTTSPSSASSASENLLETNTNNIVNNFGTKSHHNSTTLSSIVVIENITGPGNAAGVGNLGIAIPSNAELCGSPLSPMTGSQTSRRPSVNMLVEIFLFFLIYKYL